MIKTFIDPKIESLFEQIESIEKEVESYDHKLDISVEKEMIQFAKSIEQFKEITKSIQGSSKDIQKLTESLVYLKTNNSNKSKIIAASATAIINIGAELFSQWKNYKEKKKLEKRIQEIIDDTEKNKANLLLKRNEILSAQLPQKKEIAKRKRNMLESLNDNVGKNIVKFAEKIKQIDVAISEIEASNSLIVKTSW